GSGAPAAGTGGTQYSGTGADAAALGTGRRRARRPHALSWRAVMLKLLDGHKVALLDFDAERGLLRYLQTLGAECCGVVTALEQLQEVSFLLDGCGLPALAARGWQRSELERRFPALIHVSVSPFGSSPAAAGLHGS